MHEIDGIAASSLPTFLGGQSQGTCVAEMAQAEGRRLRQLLKSRRGDDNEASVKEKKEEGLNNASSKEAET